MFLDVNFWTGKGFFPRKQIPTMGRGNYGSTAYLKMRLQDKTFCESDLPNFASVRCIK